MKELNFAIIENNKVTNIIVAEETFTKSIGAVFKDELPITIGDEYIDSKFKCKVFEYDEAGKETGFHFEYFNVPLTPKQTKAYEDLTKQYIHEKYSYDDENKVIREYLSDQTNVVYKQAFDEYNAYVLECKNKAKQEIHR